MTPCSERFTLSTSSACRSTDMLRWITPMPPSRAMAMAMRASVTVSIPADMSGRFSLIPRGRTLDFAGISSTSSKVSPSRENLSSRIAVSSRDSVPV